MEKILVKVGKTSNVKFRGAQVFRAVTMRELDSLADNNPDASIVIVENIKQSDGNSLKDFITKFEANQGKKVFFFVPDNDDATCGIADELAYDIYLSLDNLYKAIKIGFGLTVDPDISLSHEYDEFGGDAFDHSFVDTIAAINENKQTNIVMPDIESKDDLPEYEERIYSEVPKRIKVDITKKPEPVAVEEPVEVIETIEDNEVHKVDTAEVPETPEDIAEETNNVSDETVSTEESTEHTGTEVIGDVSSVSSAELDKLKETNSDQQEKISKLEDELTQLRNQLRDSIARSKNAQDLVKAIEHERDALKEELSLYSDELVLEDPIGLAEYQEMLDTVKNMGNVDSNVSETVKEDTAETLQKLAELESAKEDAIKQLDGYKERLKESGVKLNEANSRLTELSSQLEEANQQIESLKGQIASAADNDSYQTELLSKITTLEAEAQSSKEIIDSAKKEIEDISAERDAMFNRAEKESAGRIFLLRMIFNAIKEIESQANSAEEAKKLEANLREQIAALQADIEDEKFRVEEAHGKLTLADQKELDFKKRINELITQMSEQSETLEKQFAEKESGYKSALDSQKSSYEETITSKDEALTAASATIQGLSGQISSKDAQINQLGTELNQAREQIVSLQTKVSEVDTRVELARNYGQEEANKARADATTWKAKYDVVAQQLAVKEQQYNSFAQAVGLSEEGAKTLVQSNQILEEMTKSLREQIVTLQNDLDKAQKEKLFAQRTADQLKETNKNLGLSMKAMSIGIAGGGISGSAGILPIKYEGRGFIIPVFGSGSFGITTTAMSLAFKLSTQAKVIYIDFDLVAPKADGWFSTNPIIKNIPGIAGNAGSTGLGILVDQQFGFWMANASSIILKTPFITKGGCLHYLSGFYETPDSIRLVSTDFSSFLNYCGNNYTYVIVDFGRLGSSELNDQIIKAFSDIAYRCVAVTTPDKFEIRTFRMKIAKANVDITNIAWLVNMCQSTNLEEMAKNAISPASYGMVNLDQSMYGVRTDFIKNSATKARFLQFMDKSVFRR